MHSRGLQMFDREKQQSDAEFRSLAERFQRFAARQRAPGKLPRDPFTERSAAPEHTGTPPRLSDLFGGHSAAETPHQRPTGEPAAHERPDTGIVPEAAARDEGGASASSASEPLPAHRDDAVPHIGEAAEMHAPATAGDEPAAADHPAQGMPPTGGEAAAPWQPWAAEATADPWQWQTDRDEEAWPHRATEPHAGDTPELPDRRVQGDEAGEHDAPPAWPAAWQNGASSPRASELYEHETPPAPAAWHVETMPQDRGNGTPFAPWPPAEAEEPTDALSIAHRDDTGSEAAPLHAASAADAPTTHEAATGPSVFDAEAQQRGDDAYPDAASTTGSALDEHEDTDGANAAPVNADLPAAVSREAPPAKAPWSLSSSDEEPAATEQPLFFTPPRRPQPAVEATGDPWESAATPFALPPAQELQDADAEERPLSAWPATDGFRHNESARPVRPPAAEEFISGEAAEKTRAERSLDQYRAPGFAAFARQWQEEHRGEIARPLRLRTAEEPERQRGLFARLRGALFGSEGAALGDTAVAFEPDEEDKAAPEEPAPATIPPPADEQPRGRFASLRYSVMQHEEEEEDGFATGIIARVKRSWFRETPDPLAIGAGLAIAIAVGLVLIGVLFRHGGKPEVQTSSSGPSVAETSVPATASATASPISAFRAPTLMPVPTVTPLALAPIARAAQATPAPPSATVPVPTTVPIQTPAPPPLTRPARTATFVPPQAAANNNNTGGSSLPSLVGNASTSPSGTLSASAPPPAASAPVYTSGGGSASSASSGGTARYAPVPISSGGSSSASSAAAAAPPSPPDVGAALSDAAAAASRAAAAAAQRAGGGTSTGR